MIQEMPNPFIYANTSQIDTVDYLTQGCIILSNSLSSGRSKERASGYDIFRGQ